MKHTNLENPRDLDPVRVRIVRDRFAESPLKHERLGHIVFEKHRTYSIGHQQEDWLDLWILNNLDAVMDDDYFQWSILDEQGERHGYDWVLTVAAKLFAQHGCCIHLLYEGVRGLIYMRRRDAEEIFGNPFDRTRVIACLQEEWDEYRNYLDGEVFGYVLENAAGDEIESCYGFFGTNWQNNGLTDYIPQTLHAGLADALAAAD